MTQEQLILNPIGRVTVDSGKFRLQIDPPYRPALVGLDGFSHVNVLWWCHGLDSAGYRRIVDCDKPYRKGPAKLGIFATRSPARPNPIALTLVTILD